MAKISFIRDGVWETYDLIIERPPEDPNAVWVEVGEAAWFYSGGDGGSYTRRSPTDEGV